jgi:hypothetical protein
LNENYLRGLEGPALIHLLETTAWKEVLPPQINSLGFWLKAYAKQHATVRLFLAKSPVTGSAV